MLERVRLLVHLVPRDAEDLHEEGLDQAVAGDDAARRGLAHVGEAQALALVAHDEAVVDEAPHHLERRRLRDAHRAGQVGLRGVDARLVHPEELLEVLLDGRCEGLHRAESTGQRSAVPGGPLSSRRWRDVFVNTARVRAAAALAVAAAALALVAAAPARRAAADGPGWTTWGNSPVRAVARLRIAADGDERGAACKLAWTRPLGGVGAAQPLYLRRIAIERQAPRHLRGRERGGARHRLRRAQPARCSGRARSAPSTRAACRCRKGIFGVTGTPVYDPASAVIVYLAATDRLWAIDVRTGAARTGWPVALPMDQYHEHVWGALALGNGHVYFGIASYCDRRPYSGRVLAGLDAHGRGRPLLDVRHDRDGRPGGGGIWGWGGVAITGDGHIWAAVANANIAAGADEALGPRRVGRRAQLDARAARRRATRPGMPIKGDFGFGSTPDRLQVHRLRPAWSRPRARTARSTCGSARKLAAGPDPAARARLPRDALRLARLGSGDTAALRHDLAGLRRQPVGARRARADGEAASSAAPGRRAWAASSDAIPTVANDTVVVATGTGHLRVYATATGKLLANRELHGAAFAAPIAIGRDVAVVTWSRKLMVFRLARRRLRRRAGPPGALSCAAWPSRSIFPPSPAAAPVRGERRLDFAPPALGDEERANVLRSLETGWLTTGPFARQLESEFADVRGGAAGARRLVLHRRDVPRAARARDRRRRGRRGHHDAADLARDGQRDRARRRAAGLRRRRRGHALPRPRGRRGRRHAAHPRRSCPCTTPGIRAISPRSRRSAASTGCAWSRTPRTPPRHGSPTAARSAPSATSPASASTPTRTSRRARAACSRSPTRRSRARITSLRLHGLTRDSWKRYEKKGPGAYDVLEPGYKLNLSDLHAGRRARPAARARRAPRAPRRPGRALRRGPRRPRGHHAARPAARRRGRARLAHLRRAHRARRVRGPIATPTPRRSARRASARACTSCRCTISPTSARRIPTRPLPVAEAAGAEVLSLPLSPAHSLGDVDDVIAAVRRLHAHFTR